MPVESLNWIQAIDFPIFSPLIFVNSAVVYFTPVLLEILQLVICSVFHLLTPPSFKTKRDFQGLLLYLYICFSLDLCSTIRLFRQIRQFMSFSYLKDDSVYQMKLLVTLSVQSHLYLPKLAFRLLKNLYGFQARYEGSFSC